MTGAAAKKPEASNDILGMSDEDFLQANNPGDLIAASSEKIEGSPAEVVEENTNDGGDTAGEKEQAQEVEEQSSEISEAEDDSEKSKDNPNPLKGEKPAGETDPAEGAAKAENNDPAPDGDLEKANKKADEKTEEEAKSESVNYEAEFKKIMAPFKANGKEISVRNPDEAIKLMQMGANYTYKMQQLQPYRRVLTMLENNNLLDENELGFLIDLKSKDPGAIQKLLKDSGIDPVDIDTQKDSTYVAGNHNVTDQDVNFRTALSELSSEPEGVKTIQMVNTWDTASKQAIYDQPEILTIMHQQRENGVFDLVSTEIDRLKTLGEIPATMPFIKAYDMVGAKLAKENGLNASPSGSNAPIPATTPSQTDPARSAPAPEVVATTTGAPKQAVKNGDKADAAAPTRKAPAPRREMVNPLSMSDDDFLKQMEGRLGR
mgnify:CR=1 FL=1